MRTRRPDRRLSLLRGHAWLLAAGLGATLTVGPSAAQGPDRAIALHPTPCAMNHDWPVRRIHVMDSRVPGPGAALTMVFVHGKPVMLLSWGGEAMELRRAVILASLWELHDEGLAEAFIAKVAAQAELTVTPDLP